MKTPEKVSEQQKWEIITQKTSGERKQFRAFVQNFYKRFYKREFSWNWHFDVIFEEFFEVFKSQKKISVEKRKTKILIFNVPPRSGKTEFFCKLLPIWLKGHFEELNFITSGYSYTLMKDFSNQAKEYWNSQEFQYTFPWRSKLDIDSAGEWGINRGGKYYATGSGGSITGRGADVFVIDDPLKPDSVARTGNEMDHINAWFGNTVISRLNPDGVKIIVVIMQRLHDNDLCGYLLEQFSEEFENGNYKHISIPAIAEENSVYRKKGESFFPERFSLEDLHQKRNTMNTTQGAHYFSAQYQQNPLDTENAEFKREWFQYFRDSVERKYSSGYIGVDIALSEKNTSDWRSIVVVSQDREGRFYVRENYFSRKNSSDVLDDLFRIQKKYDYPVILEANGAQKYFANAVRKEMTHRDEYFLLKEITARGDKNARLRATLLPLYQNFRVFHEENLRDDELEKEILRFPKSRHDDNMDALETAISGFRDFGKEVNLAMGSVTIEGYDDFLGDEDSESGMRNDLMKKLRGQYAHTNDEADDNEELGLDDFL